jgi:hypothetical protein
MAANKHAVDARAHECAALREPDAQCCNRLGADRAEALLATLAQYAHARAGKVQILEPQRGQLGEPQPARIQQFHERQVARRQCIVGLERQQARHLIHIQCLRQAPGGFWAGYFERRIALQCALAQQEAEESSQGGEPALDAAALQTARMALRGKAAHVLMIEPIPLLNAVALAPVLQRAQIAPVSADRMHRQPPFSGHKALKALEPLRSRGAHRLLKAAPARR